MSREDRKSTERVKESATAGATGVGSTGHALRNCIPKRARRLGQLPTEWLRAAPGPLGVCRLGKIPGPWRKAPGRGDEKCEQVLG